MTSLAGGESVAIPRLLRASARRLRRLALLGTCAASALGLAACGQETHDAPTPSVRAPVVPVAQEPEVVGYWESDKTSKGGLRKAVWFRADGVVFDRTVVALDGTYTLQGADLKVEPAGEPALSFKLSFEGAVQVREAAGSVQRLERFGAAAPATGPRELGRWSYVHATGATAFEEFQAGGAWRMRLPLGLAAQRAPWTSSRPGVAEVLATFGGRTRFEVQRVDGTPTLRASTGHAYAFVAPDPWFTFAEP
jgi:hypothetical protein